MALTDGSGKARYRGNIATDLHMSCRRWDSCYCCNECDFQRVQQVAHWLCLRDMSTPAGLRMSGIANTKIALLEMEATRSSFRSTAISGI
jgi:hypothetical protein